MVANWSRQELDSVNQAPNEGPVRESAGTLSQ